MAERIISADSHFEIPVERVMEYLPEKVKAEYQELQAGIAQNMASMLGGGVKPQLRNKPEGAAQAPEVPRPMTDAWPALGRPGGSDPFERIKDMDIDQVDAEVLYLNFGMVDSFYQLDDDGASAGFHAFTSAAIDIAKVNPDRLVPVYPLAVHDIDWAIKEARLIANEGGRAVMLPAYPTDHKLAPYWDEVYDPLFSALEEMELPISQHVGVRSSAREIGLWDPTPARAIMQSIPPIFMAELLGGWVLTGIFDRHPNLRVVLVEAGLGWIPYYLQRLDKMRDRHGWEKRGMVLSKLPSEYWHSNMAATFEEDIVAMKLLEELGLENIMWATDYPHPDCTWPESQKVLHDHFDHLEPDVMRQIVGGTAAKLYKL